MHFSVAAFKKIGQAYNITYGFCAYFLGFSCYNVVCKLYLFCDVWFGSKIIRFGPDHNRVITTVQQTFQFEYLGLRCFLVYFLAVNNYWLLNYITGKPLSEKTGGGQREKIIIILKSKLLLLSCSSLIISSSKQERYITNNYYERQ